MSNPSNAALRGPLFLGSGSDDVKWMQRSLKERFKSILAAHVIPLTAAGAFRLKTVKRVRALQSFQKLVAVGTVKEMRDTDRSAN
jgi:hypothetical protein